MTLEEALQTNITKMLETTFGDDILSVCYRIYSNHSSSNMKSLRALNKRYDWGLIQPGSEIKYLPESVNDQIDEL